MLLSEQTRSALTELHRLKTDAYGNAWKKRGEVLGVLCNIARKVDRVEVLCGGGHATHDESLIDTCVDLLVYCIKYQTFLLDLEEGLATTSGLARPVFPTFSDGLDGFAHVLQTVDLTLIDHLENADAEALLVLPQSFNAVEECFSGVSATALPQERLLRARSLTESAVRALSAAAQADFDKFKRFVAFYHNPLPS
jgi:hypothetical protein